MLAIMMMMPFSSSENCSFLPPQTEDKPNTSHTKNKTKRRCGWFSRRSARSRHAVHTASGQPRILAAAGPAASVRRRHCPAAAQLLPPNSLADGPFSPQQNLLTLRNRDRHLHTWTCHAKNKCRGFPRQAQDGDLNRSNGCSIYETVRWYSRLVRTESIPRV